MPNDQDIDLDEDLFGFDVPEETIAEETSDEEDLDALFAAFQTQEHDQPTPADTQAGVLDEFMASGTPSDAVGAATTSASSAVDAGPQSPAAGAPGAASHGTYVVAGSSLLSKSSLMVLIAVTLLNGLVGVVTLRNNGSIRDSVLQAQRDIADTAVEMIDYSGDTMDKLVDATTPLVPPNPDQHPTFERAQAHIEAREFAMARQRIYALLSVVDGLDPEQRATVEARAHYLLAEATHLEALARMGQEQ